MLKTNKKKISEIENYNKKLTIENNSVAIWWIGTFPANLALI